MPDTRETDTEFYEETLKRVEEDIAKDGWTVTSEAGWSIFVPGAPGLKPMVGSTIRYYGRGIGYPVRGIVIDGKVSFYRTLAEEEQRRTDEIMRLNNERHEQFRRDRDKLDAQYEALPSIFKRRLDSFRAARPDWRVQFESYEMSCCVDAVKIAEACQQDSFGRWLREHGVRVLRDGVKDRHDNTPADGTTAWEDTPTNRLRAYAAINSAVNDYDYQLQQQAIPGLFEGHSGNSFGCAVQLAYLYLTEPEKVYLWHGALTPLVGCDEYGCRHPR